MKPNIPFHTGDRPSNWNEGDPIPDFETVLEAAQTGKNGGFRNPRTWLLLGAAAVAGLFAWVWSGKDQPVQETADVTYTSASFEGPMDADWSLEPDVYTFPVNQDCYILTDDGLGISIPAGSFNTAEEMVSLEVRLLDDVVKIHHSALPMDYDSAGVRYAFMSDGMMELHARTNEGQVDLLPGALIRLEVPAKQETTGFNHYTLNADRSWTFEESLVPITYSEACDQREPNAELAASTQAPAPNYLQLAQLEQTLRSVERSAPIEPVVANPVQDHFDLDVLPGEFPELQAFEGMQFEVRGPGFHPDYFDQIWEDFRIDRLPESNQFQVTLKGEKHTRTFKVLPVVEPEAFAAAHANYQAELAEHTERTTDLQAQIDAEQRILNTLEQQAVEARELGSGNRTTTFLSEFALDLAPDRMVRVLNIGSLGVCNVDQAFDIPRVKPVDVILYAEIDGERIRPEQALLCDAKRNRVVSLRGENLRELRYLDRWENYIISSLDGKQTLVATPEMIARLDRDAQRTQTLQLRVIDEPVKNLEELRAYLAVSDNAVDATLSR